MNSPHVTLHPSLEAAAAIAPSTSWFNTPEKIAALRAAAERWCGTPFFANSEACGRDGGVDCIHLLHGIYAGLGVIPPQEIPPHAMDWGDHADRSLLLEALETWPDLVARFGCVYRRSAAAAGVDPFFTAAPGDLLVFNGGRVPHHGGLMLDRDEFVHALRPEGVHRLHLRAAVRGWKILGSLVAIYRPRPHLP